MSSCKHGTTSHAADVWSLYEVSVKRAVYSQTLSSPRLSGGYELASGVRVDVGLAPPTLHEAAALVSHVYARQ